MKKKPYRRTKPNIKRKSRSAKTFTVREVARYTGIGINALYDLIRTHELPAFTVGSKNYVLRSALDKWLEKRGNNAA